jgi:H+-transporting ATPase
MSDPVAPALPALFERLHTDGQGLSSHEASERLQSFGPNALQEHSRSRLQILLSYLWGPMPWMIEVAILLCALVGDWVDFLIISVLLLGNTAIAYLEETSAGDAVAALKAQLALESLAKRDGCWTSIPASQVVPGDRLRIALGDVIPADLVLLTEDPIEVDQSALTGESLAVEHRSGELIYSGSILKRGRAEGIVAATSASAIPSPLMASAPPSSCWRRAWPVNSRRGMRSIRRSSTPSAPTRIWRATSGVTSRRSTR